MKFTYSLAYGYITLNWKEIFGYGNEVYNDKLDRAQVLSPDKKAQLVLNDMGDIFIAPTNNYDNNNEHVVVIPIEDNWVATKDIKAIAEALVAEIEKPRGWTAEHSKLAQSEGWDLFDTGDGMLHIERDDALGLFQTDEQVWKFVLARAVLGSEIARIAVEYDVYYKKHHMS